MVPHDPTRAYLIDPDASSISHDHHSCGPNVGIPSSHLQQGYENSGIYEVAISGSKNPDPRTGTGLAIIGPMNPPGSSVLPETSKPVNRFLAKTPCANLIRATAAHGRVVSTSTRKQKQTREQIEAAKALTAVKRAERE
ncbi:hypothetical protein PGT21_000535 [Puccinia graminis f. sp. tritici]|uniref:Uncharacterized protein n=1 Tax=Puccinia graminis f. sp. tritici TaxID=56615 RepID=A0A5B0QVC7_PUCGR|nr:hypothetical protein PGT21_000535 [Puccinia graminis f. sp. tritici]KAA1127770.1 hypothetical protein PGTUg99_001395 [Puccinia graminis f. sp. tritici]